MGNGLRTCVAIAPVLLAIACQEPRPALPPGPDSADGADGGQSGTGAGGSPAGGGTGGAGAGGGSAGSGACNDGPADAGASCVDFGVVRAGFPIGEHRTVQVPVRNLSRAPLDLCPQARNGPFDDVFDVEVRRLQMPPLGTASVAVGFTAPEVAGLYQGELSLSPCTPCTDAPPRTVCLRGEAAVEAWSIEPDPIAFGPQPAGSSTCRSIRVRNHGPLAIRVREVVLDDGLTSSPGTFTLDAGDIVDREIPPGGSATFDLCFLPAEVGAEYAGQVFVQTAGAVRRAAVTAGGKSCFAADPPVLDLGLTIPGVPIAGRVALRDICGHARLVRVRIEPQLFELDHAPLPIRLDATGLPVDVLFDAAGAENTASAGLVAAISTVDGEKDVFRVPVYARILRGEPCTLTGVPDVVRFEVGAGHTGSRQLVLHNQGSSACLAWGFGLSDGDAGFRLDAPAGLVTIDPGGVLWLGLTYARAPAAGSGAAAELLFRRMTPPRTDPLVRVKLVNVAP